MTKKKKKRKLSAWEVAVMLRVRDQLLRFKRVAVDEPDLTLEECWRMDRTVMMMEVVDPKQTPTYWWDG